jgi:hypothetical protein
MKSCRCPLLQETIAYDTGGKILLPINCIGSGEILSVEIVQEYEPRRTAVCRQRHQGGGDLSVHHVEGVILKAGHTAQQLSSDYGYDLVLFTYDELGYLEPGLVYFQLKATESLVESGASYFYDLDVRDYNLWVREKMPVVLVLFDASRQRAYWQCIQSYFGADKARAPKTGAKTLQMRIPKRQAVTASRMKT